MSIIVDRYRKIKSNINNENVNIIAISKTFSFEHIKPLVEHGHIHFGENKVKETESKWLSKKENYPNVKLHLVGTLQTNKAKNAVKLFDYIHSLDSERLAHKLNNAEISLKKKLNYFIQVNIGEEKQKSGITPGQLNNFYNYCKQKTNLNIIGLMAIPPNDDECEKHFKYLQEISFSLDLKNISMGMSADYNEAIKYNSNYVRLGSAIFGSRN